MPCRHDCHGHNWKPATVQINSLCVFSLSLSLLVLHFLAFSYLSISFLCSILCSFVILYFLLFRSPDFFPRRLFTFIPFSSFPYFSCFEINLVLTQWTVGQIYWRILPLFLIFLISHILSYSFFPLPLFDPHLLRLNILLLLHLILFLFSFISSFLHYLVI